MSPVAPRRARWSGLATLLLVMLLPGPAVALTRTAEVPQPDSLLLLGVGLILVAVVGGCLAGALWAIGPAWLQTRFEVPLLITTLLLNYIAASFAADLLVRRERNLLRAGAAARHG